MAAGAREGSMTITARDEAVFRMKAEEGLTYPQIAERIGRSTCRARQIMERTVRRLRHPWNADHPLAPAAHAFRWQWEIAADKQMAAANKTEVLQS
jgi:Sigma-70, region 4